MPYLPYIRLALIAYALRKSLTYLVSIYALRKHCGNVDNLCITQIMREAEDRLSGMDAIGLCSLSLSPWLHGW